MEIGKESFMEIIYGFPYGNTLWSPLWNPLWDALWNPSLESSTEILHGILPSPTLPAPPRPQIQQNLRKSYKMQENPKKNLGNPIKSKKIQKKP